MICWLVHCVCCSTTKECGLGGGIQVDDWGLSSFLPGAHRKHTLCVCAYTHICVFCLCMYVCTHMVCETCIHLFSQNGRGKLTYIIPAEWVNYRKLIHLEQKSMNTRLTLKRLKGELSRQLCLMNISCPTSNSKHWGVMSFLWIVFIKAHKEGMRPKQVNPFLEAVVTLQGGKKLAFVFLRLSEARERGQGKPKSVAPIPETHSKAVSQGETVIWRCLQAHQALPVAT